MDNWLDFDEWAGFPSGDVSYGFPVDFDWGNVDFGLGDWGFNNLDLAKLKNFGFDLSNLTNPNFDISDLMNWGADVGFDLSELGIDLGDISLDVPYQDLGDTGTLLDTYAPYGSTIDPYEIDQMTSRDETNALLGTDTEEELRNKFWKEQIGGSGLAGGATAVPGGATLERVVYDDGSEQVIKKYDDGTEEVISTTDTDGNTTYPGTETPTKPTPITPTKPIFQKPTTQQQATPDWLKSLLQKLTPSKDNAMLMALLGGLMGLLNKGSSSQQLPAGYQGGIPKYTATRVPGRGVQYTRAAQGGLMSLKQGQYLDGATDGMADKIQTNIDGKQPARLSHGEFVIPADVVSHLGNGNSDAGADVLYEMMAKVRKARTGTPKQGKQINPRKMIPA